MEEREEVTATSFRVMVSEAEPYGFQTCAAQQLQSSVRITHITFTPPSPEELEAYMQHREKLASATPPCGRDVSICPATFARLRTLCASGELESHTMACFPWSQNEETTTALMAVHGNDESNKNKSKNSKNKKGESQLLQSTTTAAAHPLEQVQLAGLFDVVLPRQTDICSNVDLRFDVDGSVWLEVVGPGSVTFFGEQNSSLIPEWLSHRFFTVSDDDEETAGEEEEEEEEEEEDEEEEGDIAAMYGLVH
ncbi:hypothetical protein MOQ_008004 [Trypanosoma cruzi marinkellei]|uniref:Uncharacterized protein n=1 Tax=Trypanosoma cruzi marinkellei TaxID=85056 RepID=K2N0Z5_TRYCR|nr:hypothetical protein MOQ_008004 [Trypanosoma cruzi marinkellei]